MKYLIAGIGATIAIGFLMQPLSPVQAQTADEIKRICYNKYNLGKYGSAAPEAQRKEAAAKIAACVRSKGKS
jgi:hypothetical protein